MRRRLFPLTLFLLAATLTVVLSEAAYRVSCLYICTGRGHFAVKLDPLFGYTHAPGASHETHSCVGRSFEFRNTVHINSHGLRDAETPYERTPGLARVLALGDSVVEAMQVQDREPFTEVVESILSARGLATEVVNAGHAGYTTDNQVLFYENEGRRYRPDVVLSEFNLLNDVAEQSPIVFARMYADAGIETVPRPGLSIDGRGRLVTDSSPLARYAESHPGGFDTGRNWAAWLHDNLYLWRFVERALSEPTPRTEPDLSRQAAGPYGVFATDTRPEWDEAWRFVEAGYRRLRDQVEADGARLVVLVMPSRENVDPKHWEVLAMGMPALTQGKWDIDAPRRRILAFLEREHIEAMDATPALQAHLAATGDVGFYDFNAHPTASGHRVIAEAIAPELERLLRKVGGSRTDPGH